jgi:hypothetical protein
MGEHLAATPVDQTGAEARACSEYASDFLAIAADVAAVTQLACTMTVPVIAPMAVSVIVKVSVPAVFSVTLKEWTPLSLLLKV